MHCDTHPLHHCCVALKDAPRIVPPQEDVLRQPHPPPHQRDVQNLGLGQVFEGPRNEAREQEDVEICRVVRHVHHGFSYGGQILSPIQHSAIATRNPQTNFGPDMNNPVKKAPPLPPTTQLQNKQLTSLERRDFTLANSTTTCLPLRFPSHLQIQQPQP